MDALTPYAGPILFLVVFIGAVAFAVKKMGLAKFETEAQGPAGTKLTFRGEREAKPAPLNAEQALEAPLDNAGDWLRGLPALTDEELREALKFRTYDAGRPPSVKVWFGRKDELRLLSEFGSGVAAVTGVGGQGKSSFAARVQQEFTRGEPNAFWDWRDAREAGERFETQLVSLVTRITSGRISGAELASAETADIIRLFFRLLRGARALFVFDNVDHYVDVDSGQFIGSFGKFVAEALREDRNVLIIATCRPSINYPSMRFREVPLKGLSLEESQSLFRARSVKAELVNGDFTVRLHDLTRGHPFWLNMLALQVSRTTEDPWTIEANLRKFEDRELERPLAILQPTWDTLGEGHRTIVRALGEFTRPVSEDRLQKTVSSKLGSDGQFRRKFRALVSAGLLIEKPAAESVAEYELHPIVLQFIRRMFAGTERRPITVLVIDSCKESVTVAVTRVGKVAPEILEDCAMAVDLALDVGETRRAASMCKDLRDSFTAGGLLTEYARLANDVIEQLDWTQVGPEDEDLQDFCEETIAAFALLGRVDDVRRIAEIAERVVPKGTARYVGWCGTLCHSQWTLGEYQGAIDWGRRGSRLKSESDLDTRKDTEYSLHLAVRDSGDPETALSYFLAGRTAVDLLSLDHHDGTVNAPLLGNVGRCLHLMGRHELALEFYIRSADLLLGDDDAQAHINRGWAGLWIAEVMAELEDPSATTFATWTSHIWARHAPVHLKKLPPGIVSGGLLEPDEEPESTDASLATLENRCRAELAARLPFRSSSRQ